MDNEQVILEQDLLYRLSKGDEAAFVSIFDLYSARIYNFIIKYVQSPPLAEDLTQEVFMKLWESRAQVTKIESFKAYLFVIARNHTLNSLKKAFKSEAAVGEVVKNYVTQRSNTEEDILHKEYLQFLKRVLDSLPERSRRIFILCREEGKSYEEVAAAMGISKNAVKNHMVFSMKLLRSSVQKDLGISMGVLFAALFK
ncbi:RNA polymerase sigma factor [Arcticibacter tournemirensis]|uniref:RNA polymerase sigma-70 factor n=1 Tax=Arcticibacter tournemirensis TaxID=699437 RepID=A0A4V1KI38_9SPHI|nr:RNA polymerase sigma-70 factor [Arcticibacter tournemirensis]RXF69342.1 RNA polymerase sigma-70 factor [Arcticibacter tournemirensis]